MLLLASVALAQQPPSIDPVSAGQVRSKRDAIVVVGVEDYVVLPDVPYAVADAKSAYGHLVARHGTSKRRSFSAQDPTTDQLRALFQRGGARVRSGGTLWIYFAGQAVVGPDESPLLLAADADLEQPRGISVNELEALATRSRADRVVILLDVAVDGSARDELVPATSDALIEWGEGTDGVVIWAADRNGAARGYGPAGHGLFTYLALGAMQGWADGALDGTKDGQVTLSEAQQWVADSARDLGRLQRPTQDTRDDVADWVISSGELRDDMPSKVEFQSLSVADRNARMDAAWAHAEDQAVDQLLEAMAQLQTGEAGPEALEDFIEDWERHAVTLQWVPPIAAVAEAEALLAQQGAAPTVPEPDGAVETDQVVAVVEPEDPPEPTMSLSDDTCDDLIGMEPDALLGRFSPGRIECIEEAMTTASQTDQDKLSRLLMANAKSKDDTEEWARLLLRHLEDVSRADPDLCFLYALHLHKSGVANGEEAIVWANLALDNKQEWHGDVYTERVYGLHKLRTEAAAELWRDAEQNLIADPTDENDDLTVAWRAKTKSYSREWLDYAAASGQSPDRALELCVSAAGTKSACQPRR